MCLEIHFIIKSNLLLGVNQTYYLKSMPLLQLSMLDVRKEILLLYKVKAFRDRELKKWDRKLIEISKLLMLKDWLTRMSSLSFRLHLVKIQLY